MVADELVDENDLVVNRGGKGVGLGEEAIFGIVFYRADERSLLFGGQGLIVGDFLEVTPRSGLCPFEM